MNRAVLGKLLRDYWLLIAVLVLGILAFEVMAVRFLREVEPDLALFRVWLERPLIRMIVRMALGADLAADPTVTSVSTLLIIHPVMFALAWTLLLTVASNPGAGEIGRGTADLLLTLPLSRAAVYVTASVVCFAAALLVSAAPVTGIWLGVQLIRLDNPLAFERLALASVNLAALHFAVAALTLMVGAFGARRSTTLGIMIGVILFSDVVGFFSLFLDVLGPLRYIGLSTYYRPLVIVRDNALPVLDMTILLAIGVIAWCVGLWHYTRRDIPAA
jgi:ABC-2 type transport system permease protein